ncbi:MAG: hypothetical protein AAF085_14185, partial [Planctomycetota bacterium]
MRNPFALPILCMFASLSGGDGFGQTVAEPRPLGSSDSVQNFGFWKGEWLVENTRYDIEKDSFTNVGTATASAEMLLDGRVLLERWEGEEGPIASAFGVTLRYFDADRDRWVTITNWPAGSPLSAQFTHTNAKPEIHT